jgi:hypothetical protein
MDNMSEALTEDAMMVATAVDHSPSSPITIPISSPYRSRSSTCSEGRVGALADDETCIGRRQVDWRSLGNSLTLVVPSAYHKVMSSVVKRSISLPTELFEALAREAAQDGRTVSATLADAADLWLSTRRGLRSVRAWERDNGALTAEELAEADRILDLAGVGSFKAAEGAA